MARKKILLIEPPFYRLFKETYSLIKYPLSLAYLAAMIKRDTDWDVVVYNADFSEYREGWKIRYIRDKGFYNYLQILKNPQAYIWREIKEAILEFNPDIIGISIKSQNFAAAKNIAKIAKDINKDIVVMAGGPHASMASSDILNFKEFQICVRGEGEETIKELLRSFATQELNNLDKISGISYSRQGEIHHNPDRGYMEDLDSLPFPHKFAPEVLKDYEKYPKEAFQGIFATRGCPYDCFFCGSRLIWGRKIRYRSSENVTEEIKGLQKLGLRTVHFEDDSFGINKDYTMELCNRLKNKCIDLRWSCEINVKSADKEMISAMKESGCYAISLGVESGNDDILRKINKHITVNEILAAYKTIKKERILLTTFFIIGFPWDNRHTINDTYNLIKKMSDSVISYSIFTPYPGTEAYDYCKEKGLIKEPFDVSLYNHQSPANSFCVNLSYDEFRRMAERVEDLAERINLINQIKRFFLWDFKRKIANFDIRFILKELRLLLESLGFIRK
ncbi:MAG: radical SAM protein [Candidatus Omnitrophica bacterium]|nr:radical SAM protein [Candidatus Omnitrophota bacterium]